MYVKIPYDYPVLCTLHQIMPLVKDWATPATRQKHIVKLRTALVSCGRDENVEDIEQKILDKSNSLEEYLHNLSKVLVHCQTNKQQQQNMQMQQNMQVAQNLHMQRHLQMQQHMVQGMGGMQPGPPNMQAVPTGQGVMMSQQPGGGVVVMRGYPPGAPPPSHDDPEKRGALFGPPGSNMDEETLYQLKMQELQRRFIVPLQKLREKKTAGNQSDNSLKRLDEILDILKSSKKIKMDSLKQIETILIKLFDKNNTPETVGSVEKLPTSTAAISGSIEKPSNIRNTHFCQPLIDGVANHARNPSFYHTVKRTFGPALYSHYGNVTQYPPAKRHKKGDLTAMLPMMLNSEISRLPSFFKAEMKNKERGDLEVVVRHKTYHVAPKITVVIPNKYPDQSPWLYPAAVSLVSFSTQVPTLNPCTILPCSTLLPRAPV
eukprot:sb/3464888/